MNYEMSDRQVTHCADGNLFISAGRLDRTRTMGTGKGDMYSMQTESQYCNGSRRGASKIEPYVPPHRRNSYQESFVESKQGLSRSFLQSHRLENGYDYNDAASDYSSYTNGSYKNFPDRKSGHQDIINNSEKNYNIIDKFVDVGKNYRPRNYNGNDNPVESNTDFSSQIVEKVLGLVDSHVNNDLKNILGKMYEQAYGERLPPELLNRWKFVVTLKFLSQSPLPCEKFPNSSKQIQVSKPQKVPSLDIKQLGKKFWVNIYYCGSVTEMWGIIMESNHIGEIEKLSDRMHKFYENPKESHNIIRNGSYYALWDGSWHRVQCLQRDGSSATVFFIDRGDEDIVPVNKLYALASQFCELPAQAIKMSLTGLEVFGNFDELQPILIENLCDKSVFAEVDAVTEDFLSVQLYLENDKNGGVDVNNLIVEQMIKNLLNPKLHIGLEKMLPAHVSHLEKRIYIQLGIPSFKYLNLLIQKTIEYIGNANCQRHTVVRHETNKIYFVKSNIDQNWYRGKMIKFLSATEIQVFLIDVGSTTETSRENVIDLEKMHSILTKYPAQAIEVQLDQIPTLGPRMLLTLRNIISKNQNIYVKFISAGDNNNLPTVKLMRKTDSGFMVSLNDALLILNDGVVLEESKTSVDHTTNKDFSHSSAKSIRSFQSCKTKPSVSIDNVTKDFDSLSVKTWISSHHSRIEPRLLTNKSTNNDSGCSLRQPVKPSDNSKVGLVLPIDKSINNDSSSLLMQSTKPSENFKVERGLSLNKANNKDLSSSQMQPSRLSDDSEVRLGLPLNKSNEKDSGSSIMQSRKPYDNSKVGLELPFYKSIDNNSNSFSMQSTKPSDKSKVELRLPFNEPDDKALNTYLYSEKSSQSSKVEAKAEMKELLKNERTSQTGEIHVNMYLSSILSTPKVPEGKYFDVQVIKASDPSHFIVQLLRDKTLKFTKMISKMSEACRLYEGRPSTYETIQIGHLYACKISENSNRDWCRVYVTAIKEKKTAAVYCCDYGSFKTVDISNLVPLESVFYKLPSQAIWAELHGVKPTTKEWNIRASLKFQDLTESKNFVCKLISKRAVQNPPKIPVTVETIYCLEMFDTTFPDEDIYLADLLCESGVAEKV